MEGAGGLHAVPEHSQMVDTSDALQHETGVSSDGQAVAAAITATPASSGRRGPSGSTSEVDMAVRVVTRCRPLTESEQLQGFTPCVSFLPDMKSIKLGTNRRFTFDAAYGPDTAQANIFEDWVLPMVDGYFTGYNTTVFAYGQTGAGKTFSMEGDTESPGIVPRVLQALFDRIESSQGHSLNQDTFVRVSYIEIYNEEVKDLLHPSTQPKNIAIRETAHGQILMAGVREEAISSRQEAMHLLEGGSLSRTVASTAMNNRSSRSHAIFTVTMEQRAPNNKVISAKFHLVDLAGSERAKRTGNTGARLKESVTINSGLLALGNVIAALSDPKGRKHHVPYRESKLTRMLQDSLGGNSRTVMLACISPADANFEETLNTLKYASRARNITNRPIINEEEATPEIDAMREEISRLKGQLQQTPTSSSPPPSVTAAMQDDRIRHLEGTVKKLTFERDDALAKVRELEAICSDVSSVVHRVATAESLRDSLQAPLLLANLKLQGPATGADSQTQDFTTKRPTTAPSGSKGSGQDANIGSLKERLALLNAEQQACASEAAQIERMLDERGVSVFTSISAGDDHGSIVAQRSATGAGSASVLSAARRSRRRDNMDVEEQLKSAKSQIELQSLEIERLQEDLERDERIFADKMKQLKESQANCSKLEQQVIKLQSELQDARIGQKEDTAKSAQPATVSTSAQVSQSIIGQVPKQESSGLESSSTQASSTDSSKPGGPRVAWADDSPGQNKHMSRLGDERYDTLKDGAAKLAQLLEQADDVVVCEEDLEPPNPLPSESGQSGAQVSKQQLAGNAEFDVELSAMDDDFEQELLRKEKHRLEKEAEASTREFNRQQHRNAQQQRALELNIALKEDLIRSLIKTERELKAANEAASHRMQVLEAEISQLREQGAEDVQQLQDRQAQLSALKRKVTTTRSDQHSTAASGVAGDTHRVKTLQQEVARMKQQSDALRRKMREDGDKFEHLRAEHAKAIESIKKEGSKKVRDLESRLEKHKVALHRKEEALTAARKRLRDVEAAQAAQQHGELLSESNDENVSWVRRALAEHEKRQHAVDKMERELKEREKRLREREQAIKEQASLQATALRQGESVRDSIALVSAQLRDKGDGFTSASSSEMQRRELVEELTKLQEVERQGDYLTEDQKDALSSLSDRLEALDAEIDMRNERVKNLEATLGPISKQNDAPSQFNKEEISVMDEITAKKALADCIDEVCVLKALADDLKTVSKQAESHTEELRRQLSEAEASSRLRELEHQRELTRAKKENEVRVQGLVRELAVSPGPGSGGQGRQAESRVKVLEEQNSLLDKDNYYFRHANKELKRKLKELVSAGEHERARLDELEALSETLQDDNEKLRTELTNLKSFMRRSGRVSSVRVSTKDVRQLAAGEVEQIRQSLQSSHGNLGDPGRPSSAMAAPRATALVDQGQPRPITSGGASASSMDEDRRHALSGGQGNAERGMAVPLSSALGIRPDESEDLDEYGYHDAFDGANSGAHTAFEDDDKVILETSFED